MISRRQMIAVGFVPFPVVLGKRRSSWEFNQIGRLMMTCLLFERGRFGETTERNWHQGTSVDSRLLSLSLAYESPGVLWEVVRDSGGIG